LAVAPLDINSTAYLLAQLLEAVCHIPPAFSQSALV